MWRCLIRSPEALKILVILIFLLLFFIISAQILGFYFDYVTAVRDIDSFVPRKINQKRKKLL
jgi:hypothetical protein